MRRLMTLAAIGFVISTAALADEDYFQCTVTEQLSAYDAEHPSDPPIDPSRTYYLSTGKEASSFWRGIVGRRTPFDFMASAQSDIGKVFQVNRKNGQLTGGYETSLDLQQHQILKQGGKSWPSTTVPFFELIILNHHAMDAPDVTYLRIADFKRRKQFVLVGAGAAEVVLGHCK